MNDPLSPRELNIVARAIAEAGPKVRLVQVSRRLGYSAGLIYKVRYLQNCHPDIWQSCVSGMTTINQGYFEVRRGRKIFNEI